MNGVVDQQSNDGQLRELALFAGAGGGILGGKLLGWRTVCAVEINAYCAGVLVQRQNDGILAPFPIWDDVKNFDGRAWRGIVDVVSGGFPCQDISAAGKGEGIDGERSGLWREMARIIGEVRPRFAFVENSPMLTSRGIGRVLGDLAEMGYDSRWGVVSAENSGAPHKRERIWLLGYTDNYGLSTTQIGECFNSGSNYCSQGKHKACEFKRSSKQHWKLADSKIKGFASRRLAKQYKKIGKVGYARISFSSKNVSDTKSSERKRSGYSWDRRDRLANSSWWKTEPDVGRVVDGMAFRVDRLKAIGNGQVPSVAKLAWEILTEGIL